MHNKYFSEKIDWELYWKKHHEETPIKDVIFEEYLKYFPERGSLIELGGFPGKFACYFKKRFDYDVTILDYIIVSERVRSIEKLYGLEEGSIKTIKADINNYKPINCYDVVISLGFIEHFEDTKLIIKKHYELLKPGGVLLATYPNFRGINGLIQKHLDPKNYSIHNIKSMNIELLNGILKELNLKHHKVTYTGRPAIWMEPDAPVGTLMRKLLIVLSKILARNPFRNNIIFGPHILIFGIK